MKKYQVDEILEYEAKRRQTIISYALIVILFFTIALSFTGLYIQKNRVYYVEYKENSNLDYKVHLKNNEYFESSYLEKNNQYIASLIDYISADFKYNLELDKENLNYTYSYKIEYEVKVVDKYTKNSLYKKKADIISTKTFNTNSNKNVQIDEKFNIDYAYFNQLMSKFINDYDLENVDSELDINMYVDVIGTCGEYKSTGDKNAVVSLNIPLTTKTVAIDMSSDVKNTANNTLECKTSTDNYLFALIIAALSFGWASFVTYKMVNYVLKSRTAKNIYESELKKILNRYHDYIQRVAKFDLKGYQVIDVYTFEDLLEMRDCYQSPILMVESLDKTGACFFIPTTTKMMFAYKIKITEIQKNMNEKKEKDYEI